MSKLESVFSTCNAKRMYLILTWLIFKYRCTQFRVQIIYKLRLLKNDDSYLHTNCFW